MKLFFFLCSTQKKNAKCEFVYL